jgi:hypothetical protein
MLGIRDILVRIQIRIRGSIPLTNGSDPDPTPFFSDFKDAKCFFLHFISYNLVPTTYYLLSQKLNFWLKFCVKILFCKHYFSLHNTFMREGSGAGFGSVPLTNGSGPGRPKNMRIRNPNTDKNISIK